jgi:hypothetical protein
MERTMAVDIAMPRGASKPYIILSRSVKIKLKTQCDGEGGYAGLQVSQWDGSQELFALDKDRLMYELGWHNLDSVADEIKKAGRHR